MTFRLCVDLNVWIAHFLAEAKGARVSAARSVVQAVQEGRSGLGPVQLVVSHTMLSRLQDVLIRKGATPESSGRLIDLIASFARLGPAPEFPRMVLGGGVEPTRDARPPLHDPYDPAFLPKPTDTEDGRVIDTALAGRADALVTANFRDFAHHGDTVILRGRLHIRRTAEHDLVIVRPQEMAEWLRSGRRPSPP
ncbi:putative nucleic acid-binding protein [Methylorubrum rhodinum]|uniref:Putative nucleic acid-binding protein n=1 Tax=Methylorubrum rhodinum TaxID=29428 RepID=A0A840ZQ72_9HYPH|nr:PIN domain-containing protein [Methylorubrum rhodinum]MBB5759304.1 putative nucleic acid-binding protein [Methylorubrum rhodinum]